MLTVGARLFLIAAATAGPVGAAPAAGPVGAAPAAAIPIRSGRTTTIVAGIDVGAPIERTVPNATYTRAATADAEERWGDATPLYRQAIAEWTAVTRTRPSHALDLAIAKAEHELRVSQALANTTQNAQPPNRRGQISDDALRAIDRRQALDDGRLLSGKLLATRAMLGRVPAALYTHARNRLEDARDTDPPPPGRAAAGVGAHADVELLLCATYAVGGATADARLARARVTEAERADPTNTLAVAACAAALGETEAALAGLETFVLRPDVMRPDRVLRDVYLSNAWDHLRGNPRFESLFR